MKVDFHGLELLVLIIGNELFRGKSLIYYLARKTIELQLNHNYTHSQSVN